MNFELFGEKFDYFVPPLLAAAAIYMFYGMTAAVICFVVIVAAVHLKPFGKAGFGIMPRAFIATGLVCIASLSFQYLFQHGYCYSAPWGVQREMIDFLGVEADCFSNGIFGDIAYNGWKGYFRDLIIPAIGVGLLVLGVRQRQPDVA